MIDPAVLDAMLAAGCTAEQIVAAVKADAQAELARAARASEDAAAETARKRELNAVRQRRFRDRNAQSRVTSVTNGDNPSPKKETSPTPPKEKTTPSFSEDKSSSINPRAALETVLDAERAGAVLDHRKRIGKPLTAHAAKLIAGKFAKCPDANAAADAMVSNGWQGFEPEWLERRAVPQQRAASPPKQTVPQQARDELKRRMNENAPDHDTRYIDQGDRNPGFTGSSLAGWLTG